MMRRFILAFEQSRQRRFGDGRMAPRYTRPIVRREACGKFGVAESRRDKTAACIGEQGGAIIGVKPVEGALDDARPPPRGAGPRQQQAPMRRQFRQNGRERRIVDMLRRCCKG